MKKIIPILISIILFTGCSAGKSAESSKEVTETSVETTAGTTSQTTATTEMTTSETTDKEKIENKLVTLQDIINELPAERGNAKSASQLSKDECMKIGNDLANMYHMLTYNYFSGVWETSGFVNCTNNDNTNINRPLKCVFTKYSSLEDLAKYVRRCMSVTVFNTIFKGYWYAECDGQIYNYDNASGWVYTSDCYLTSYEIIDEDTIKFIFTVDDDPNEPKHNCDFIARRNEGIWMVEEISNNTSATIMYQFMVK